MYVIQHPKYECEGLFCVSQYHELSIIPICQSYAAFWFSVLFCFRNSVTDGEIYGDHNSCTAMRFQ